MGCIYCPGPGDSLEHPLLAAFGEFKGAPFLEGRICKPCNNRRLGVLGEQFSRCGPEAFLRRLYGVQGRSTHESVNPFERDSAGGRRLEMKAHDPALGIEVLFECENGTYRQQRQLVFVGKGGSTKHLPIREGTSPEQLRTAYQQLSVSSPCDVYTLYDPVTEEWVEPLLKEIFPSAKFDSNLASTSYPGAVVDISVTDRYFRAVAMMGFHYFLTQFPEYTGHEEMFSEIRQFILEGGGIAAVNKFIGKREYALLNALLMPGIGPNGWRAHLLCAEIKPGECIAYVQMFLTEDWQAPIYAVRLACDTSIVDTRGTGHAYRYFDNGPEGNFSGEAIRLESIRTDWPAPPLTPVILSA